MKRRGGETAYGTPRNLLTVAVAEGKTVVVPMRTPGRITAVGAGLFLAATALTRAANMTEVFQIMFGWGCWLQVGNPVSNVARGCGISTFRAQEYAAKADVFMLHA
jgi:hypothetical protein